MSGILNLLLAGAASVVKDAYFNLVTLLLNTTATNGAQNNTFLDSSTNNFSITRNGNTTQGTFTPFSQTGWSNFGNGTGSEGLSSATSSAYSFGTGEWSLETWFYRAGDGASSGFLETIIDMRDSDVQGNGISIGTKSNGTIWAYDANLLTSSGIFSNNTWNHLVYTRQSGALRIFVNGVLQAYNSSYTNNYTNTNCKVLRSSVNNYAFNGYVSNVRIIKGSVPSLYQTSATSTGTTVFTPPVAPLTAISGTSLLTSQSNRFVDNSSNNFALTTSGTPSVQAFSPFVPDTAYSTSLVGGSAYFDGSGDYLTVPNNAAMNIDSACSAEIWLYPILSSADQAIMSGNGNWDFLLNNSNVVMRWFYPGYVDTGVTALKLFTWNHIAFSVSGGRLSFYVNGTRTYTNASVSITNGSTNPTYIGWNGGNPLFPGYLSGARITKGSTPYDPTLTTLTVPTAPPTAITNTSLLTNFTNAGIYDSAAKNDAETLSNAQVSTTQAKWGTTSMYFDGSSSYLKFPASANLAVNSGNFTYEFWLYPTTNSDNCLFDTRAVNLNTSGFAFLIRSSVNLFVYTNNNDLTCNNAITQNAWQHVALVRNGSTMTAYVNGTSVGSVTFSNNLTDQTLSIASYVGGGGYLNGYIDDFRYTKGYARYTANFTPPAAAFPIQ